MAESKQEMLWNSVPVTEQQCRSLAEEMRVLAQPQRLMILLLLRQQRCMVADIERLTGITQPMLSQYLGQLRRAECVVSERVGRQIFYMLAQTPAGQKAQELLAILVPKTSSNVASDEDRSTASEEWPSCGHGAMFAQLL